MDVPKTTTRSRIPTIYQCDSKGRENQTVVADLDGTLLVGRIAFGYFALVAFDVGGYLRLLFLVLVSPLAGFLHCFVSESAGTKVLVFAAFAGVKVSAIESAANAVLPKYYSEDVHPETWRVFSSCGRKCVLTASPRIMAEPFLKNYLDVDVVLGTEISSYKGIATGLVAAPGVLVGRSKAIALRKAFENEEMPDIGIGDRKSDFPFMRLCKEKYIVPRRSMVRPVSPKALPKPVIFHDGRLVPKPTPLMALLIVLYFPIGALICFLRISIGCFFPISWSLFIMKLFGCKLTLRGTPTPFTKPSSKRRGVLFVCSHRTLYDAVVIAAILRRRATAITYSLPSLSEILSPIKTVRITRERAKDAELIEKILDNGEDLVVSPEGTTCREPFLLRFSSLFAELTDEIVPVAIEAKPSMFHGTATRGYKWLDPFFFAMNLRPEYEVVFLDKLTPDQTCKAGKSSHEVANNVQEMIGKAMNFKCTKLTRREKYQALAGTGGFVGQDCKV